MSPVDPRLWMAEAPPVDAAEVAPLFRPHLPPVIRGRDVVDVALPEPELMPAAVASGMEGVEKGAQRPREARTPSRRTASASAPRTPARRTAEPPAPEPPIEGQTELPLTDHQPTLWSL